MRTIDEIMINFMRASSDWIMRDKCRLDIERFYIDGYWWSGSNYGKQYKNKPKPEFNKLFKAINRISGSITDMELGAVIVSNSNEATDDDADLLMKRLRNDRLSGDGREASEIATHEAVIGGFGATKLVSKFEDEENPNQDHQYLCYEMINSACTSVFFDSASIRKDKADSRFGWHVIRVNREAIQEEYSVDSLASFSSYFESSSTINTVSTQLDAIIAHYWEVIEKKLTDYDFSAMFDMKITAGNGITDQSGNSYTRAELKNFRDEYEELMGEPVPSIQRVVKYVEYALIDGDKFLVKPTMTPFKRVPLFPRYGYHTVTPDGLEYYCGEVRKKTDLEMFHNMFGSSMMEIMAAPQISKPEYAPQQIKKYAAQRASSDFDNTPFTISDPLYDPTTKQIAALGPIGMYQPPQIGTGMQAAGMFLEQNIQEQNGIGQATVPANASGQAIQAVNERQDDCYAPLVKNTMYAIRAECEAWIPAAQTLYFTNQMSIRVQDYSGEYSQVETMQMKQLPDGSYGPFGNSARGKYTVQVKEGESYKSQKEAEFEQATQLVTMIGTNTPVGQMAALTAVLATTGEGTYFSRKIARFDQIDLMLSRGIDPEAQNEEEEQYIAGKLQQMQAAAQQQQQPDPMLIAAQAQMMEAESSMIDKQVDQFVAETGRMKVMVDAERAGADINLKQQDMQLRAWEKMQPNMMNGYN